MRFLKAYHGDVDTESSASGSGGGFKAQEINQFPVSE